MKVLNVIEHKDGSATLEVDIEEEERVLLLEVGLRTLIIEATQDTEEPTGST